jgi:hypothetical protein
MSNLSGVQFQSKDWNPFTAAAGLIDRFTPQPDKDKHYSNAMVQQNYTQKTSLTKSTKPTPATAPGTRPKKK